MIANSMPRLLGALTGLVGLALLCRADGPPRTAADPPRPPPGCTVYDPDPRHLWNRLHDALHVRATTDRGGEEWLLAPDTTAPGPDEVDPLFWPPGSRYLLTGRITPEAEALLKQAPHLGWDFPPKTRDAHRQALAVLDEFLARDGERLVRDPLPRALLQRDLWALFDTVEAPAGAKPLEGKERYRAERRALQARLAKALKRLTLSPEQVGRLPDNYAAAVAARIAPAAFDPGREQTAFLPPDLWQPEGPWVLLGDGDGGPVAREHLRFIGGRSAFFVFLRLPGGRDQTARYLERLRGWVRAGSKGDVPPFPPGTQVALARHALVLNDQGEITPTRLTETVQFRVYAGRAVDEMHSFEFKLRRPDLLAGKAGGLHAVQGSDSARPFLLYLGANAGEYPEPVLASCRSCHGASGGPAILTVRSFRLRPFERGIDRHLCVSSRAVEEAAIVHWKQEQFSWGLLQGLQERSGKD
jgi:hypothetical protein